MEYFFTIFEIFLVALAAKLIYRGIDFFRIGQRGKLKLILEDSYYIILDPIEGDGRRRIRLFHNQGNKLVYNGFGTVFGNRTRWGRYSFSNLIYLGDYISCVPIHGEPTSFTPLVVRIERMK